MRLVVLSVCVALVAATFGSASAQPRATSKQSARLAALTKELGERQARGAMLPALTIARRVHTVTARLKGKTHPDTLTALETVARLTSATGDYLAALKIQRQLVAMASKAHGKDSDIAWRAREALASQLWVAQRFDEADKLYNEILDQRRSQHGADSPLYAVYLQIYGGLLQGRGSLAAAEQYFLDAKRIYEKAGQSGIQNAGPTMSLAYLYWFQGQHSRAKAMFDTYIAELDAYYRDTLKQNDGAAGLMIGIAQLYRYAGKSAWAQPLEKRGEKLYREALAEIDKSAAKAGPNEHRLVSILSNLASLHVRRKEYDQAEAMYRRLIAIAEAQAKASPYSNEMATVGWRQSLAWLERERGRHAAAVEHLRAVRKVYERTYGQAMAVTMDQQIADSLRAMGKPREARRILTRLIERTRKSWGPRHPTVSYQLESLAVTHLVEGQAAPALKRLEQAIDIQEPALDLLLATGTESDHATYFARIAHQLHLAVHLDVKFGNNPASAELALSTILRRKGRILDAAASSVAALRSKVGARDRALLDQLSAARAKLAKLILTGPTATAKPDEYASAIAALEREVRRLEQQVKKRSALHGASNETIELDKVRRAIPPDTALVELMVYQPYDVTRWGTSASPLPRHYVAYVLRQRGPPTRVDLGPAQAIDKLAEQFLEALADPDSVDIDKRGRALYDRAFAPIARALGQTRQILLAPDGLLNLVPFGALTDPSGRYLIRQYRFTYLTSGRDLLRLTRTGKSRQAPFIVADPRFDGADDSGGNATGAKTRGRRSRALRSRTWSRLPGTSEEASALAKLVEGAMVLTGGKATESALKRLRGPRILHIATHGFFLPPEPPPQTAALEAPAPIMTAISAPPVASGAENPLLRSGLILAGANKLSSGDEDGVLTALEASGLDLTGTKLVVLSACETGVGKATEGDGVHGLRRALVIAGAESLLMSLWQVDDRATRDLMTGYYRRLLAGQGRAEALRRVQLDMLGKARYRHPYYWASFVQIGGWDAMNE